MANNKDFIVKNGLVVLAQGSAQSTSTTTGALITPGGIGVGGNINVAGSIFAGGFNLQAYDDHVIYVSDGTGSDTTGNGHSTQSAYRTIKHALSFAVAGDVVYIEPGTYQEQFPITIPQGVSVRGAGLREVTVYPTPATQTNDAFLLNGETVISDFTVAGFLKPGWAFKFAPGAKITTKSPYIERFSIQTKGTITTPTDPFGFDQGDAGNGAYLDAGVLDPTSLEPALLFNEATFIVPNATGMYMTNGARSELLNGFFYFADKAIQAEVGVSGYGGVGKTKIKLAGQVGTFTAGDTLIYKNPAGTILASGSISSVSGDYVYLTGPVWGFETIGNRAGKTITAYGNVIQTTATKKFGTSSAQFDGANDYLLLDSNVDFNFTNTDFTVEGFVLTNSTTASSRMIFDNRTASAINNPRLYLNATSLTYWANGAGKITSTGEIASTSTWYHVAVSRAGTETRMFVDGTQVGGTYTATDVFVTSQLVIGDNYAANGGWQGNIDEFRVTKGISRYNADFTAPTAPFTSDTSTVLLVHMDGGNGSTLFTDDALGTQNVYSTGASPATASRIILADYHQFGAELRCIGSAAVFGNTGVTANGTGTDLKLIAFNMSHIGSAGDLSDDTSKVIQANEVIQTNGGKVYYQTVDQNGDFRVGGSFLINQRTGDINFGSASVNISSLTNLTISDGTHDTIILPTSITVGNLLFAAGSITTAAGDLTLDPAGSLTTINSDVRVSGSFTATGVLQAGSIANATSTITGALQVIGGIGVGKDIWAGAKLTVINTATIASTVNATSTNSGALQVVGGVGIGRDLYVGGATYLAGDLYIDGDQFVVSATNLLIADKTLSLSSTATTVGAANGSGLIIGTGTGYVSFLFNGSSGNPAWLSQGSLIPSGTANLGANGTAWNLIYGNTIYDNAKRVVTSVEPTGGLGIAITGLTSTGPAAQFQVTNTGVLSIIGGTDISVNTATGNVTIIDTSTLQSVTGRGGLTDRAIQITNNTAAISQTTGSLVVTGGVGIGGALYAGTMYSNGARVWTTATLTNNNQLTNGAEYLTSSTIGLYGVSFLQAGTGISVSASTGSVTVTNIGVVSLVGNQYIGLSASSGSNVQITNLGVTNITTGSGIAVSTSTGTVNIISIDTLQLVTSRGATTNVPLSFTSTNISVSTSSGQALLVSGGIGALAVYASALYDSSNRVLTSVTPNAGQGIRISAVSTSGVNTSFTVQNFGVTATVGTTYLGVSASTGTVTFTNLGVQTLTAGTDTAVSQSTGTVTVWDISTLQSVTSRGATTNQAITITNGTNSTGTNSGALTVVGGLGVGGDTWIGGSVTILGQLNATSVQGNISTSTNIAGGTTGSIAYQVAPGITRFIGIGADKTILQSNGTTATWVSTTTLLVQSAQTAVTATNVVGGYVNVTTATFSGITEITNLQNAVSTNSGALQVAGGVGIGGDLYAGNIYDNNVRVIQQVNVGPGLSGGGVGPVVALTNTGVLSAIAGPFVGVSGATGDVTFTNLGVQQITTGSGITISTSTGTVQFDSIDTLQLVTERGATSDRPITITNTLTSADLVVTGGIYGAQNFIETSITAGTNTTASYWIKCLTFSLPNVGDSTQFKIKSSTRVFGNTVYSDNSDNDIIWISVVKDTATTLLGNAYWFNESSESSNSALITNHTVTYNGNTGLVEYWRKAVIPGSRAFVTVIEQMPANSALGYQSVTPTIVTNGQWLSAVASLGSNLPVDDPDTASWEDATFTGLVTFTNGSGGATTLSINAVTGAIQGSGVATEFNNTVTANSISLANGAITSGVTKTVNIGTLGLSGSISNINIGSTVSGALGATIVGSTLTQFTSVTTASSTSTGALQVRGGIGVAGGSYFGGDVRLIATTAASSTSTGALTVRGGVGIGGALYVGGIIQSAGSNVITAATLGSYGVSQVLGTTYIGVTPVAGTGSVTITNLGVQSATGSLNIGVDVSTGTVTFTNLGVTATIGTAYLGVSGTTGSITFTNLGVTNITTGSGITVSTGTGTVLIDSIDTLQLVTSRGATSNVAVTLSNTTNAVATNSGALVVSGGVGIGRDLIVGGSTYLQGNLYVDGAQFLVNSNSIATGDKTLTLSTGATTALLALGSGLQVGTTGSPYISWLYDGVGAWKSSGGVITNNTVTILSLVDATSTNTGALIVSGGAGFGGSIYAKGPMYSNGSQVVTAQNLGQFGVAQIIAGTAIAVSPTFGTGTVTIGNMGVSALTTTTTGGIALSTSTGSVQIVSIDTLQLVTQRGPTTNQIISLTNTSVSISTSSGQALLVSGGIGALSVQASTLYDAGNRVVTSVTPSAGSGIGISSLTATGPASSFAITNLGVQTLTAGTDTAVSQTTGTVTVWTTSTLQSVTNRGATTTNQIFITNTSFAISTVTGALQVAGGVGIRGDLWAGNIYTNGQIVGAAASTSSNLFGGLPGSIPYQYGPGGTSFIGIGATGTILTSNGTTATFTSPTLLTSGFATTATNIAGGRAGFLPIQLSAGLTGFVNSGTFGQFLQQGTNTATWVSTSSMYVNNAVYATTATNLIGGSGGQVVYQTGVGQTGYVNLGVAGTVLVSNGSGVAPSFNNTLTLAGTTQATSTNTGALQVQGGMGVGGNLWVGGVLYASVQGSINTATNVANGSIGSIVYQTAAGITGFLNPGAVGTIIRSNGPGVLPTYVGTSTFLVGNAEFARQAGNLTGGTAGQIPYQTSVGATAFIGVGPIGSLLQISAANTATFVSTGSILVQAAQLAVTATNVAGGAAGSIHIQSGPGITSFIPIGSTGSILQSNGTTAQWFSATGILSGTSQNINGGQAGWIPIQSGPASTTFINSGTAGQSLLMGVNTATWVNTSSLYVGAAFFANSSTNTTNKLGGTTGQLLFQAGANVTSFVGPGTAGQILVSNGAAAPSYNSTLTLAGTTPSNSTNTGAFQVAGGAGIGGNLYVGGTLFATVAGSITTASNISGGTAGAIHYQSAPNVTAFLSTGVAGTILGISGGLPAYITTASLYVGNAILANSANNITGGATADLLYQSAPGVTSKINIGAAGSLLQVSGGIPTWVSTGSLVAGIAARALNIAGGAANQIPYQSATSTTTFSSNFTYNGTTLTIGTGGVNAANYVPSGAGIPTNGMYLPAANSLGFATNSNNRVYITAGGFVGINNSIPQSYLDITGDQRISGIFTSTNATQATSVSTGALQTAGGAGIAKDLYVGGVTYEKRAAIGTGGIINNFTATINAGTLGTAAGNQTYGLNLYSGTSNGDYLEITNTRARAGVAWDSAGFRLQQKVDSTFMGWMQFNGGSTVGTAGGITWGGGTSTVGATSVPELMRLDVSGNLVIGTQTSPAGSNGLYVQGNVLVNGTTTAPRLFLNRSGVPGSGISWYSSGFNAWCQYMAQAGQTAQGPTANITAPTGTFVNSYALRSYIENNAGYGWTWESGTSASTTPVVKAEIRSSDGTFWTAGNIYAAGDVYSSYSDINLKTVLGQIQDPLALLRKIEVFYYEPNEEAIKLGATPGRKVGVSAQSVQAVVPEATGQSALNNKYLTVQYERLVPLLIESVKKLEDMIAAQQKQIEELTQKLEGKA